MAEIEFERRLERLFADPPSFADEAAFAARVEQKLDRGWTMRRMLIGAAGLVGGLIGASQLIMSNFFGQVETASQGSSRAIQASAAQIARIDWMPAGSGAVWVASALAVVAMGFVLTRVLEEL